MMGPSCRNENGNIRFTGLMANSPNCQSSQPEVYDGYPYKRHWRTHHSSLRCFGSMPKLFRTLALLLWASAPALKQCILIETSFDVLTSTYFRTLIGWDKRISLPHTTIYRA
jgi:hypothetical protein